MTKSPRKKTTPSAKEQVSTQGMRSCFIYSESLRLQGILESLRIVRNVPVTLSEANVRTQAKGGNLF